jgi:hypothetical protein
MPAWLEEPKVGSLITAEWARAVVRAINGLITSGPNVTSPLCVKDGVLYLGQDFETYEAKTTSIINARSGAQWGSGAASFLTVSAGGAESATSGVAAFAAWNYTGGTIPSGVRVLVRRAYGKWVIVSGDCSGVA